MKTETDSPSGREPQDDLQPVGRLIARLLDQAASTSWYGYQRAMQHGNPERAQVLERRARRYEEMRDLCHAYAWEPQVAPSRLSAEERAELNRMFKARLSQQRGEKRPRFSVVSADESRQRAYGWKILVEECRRVADTLPGDRNNVLASAAFKLGRGAVGPGYLERDTAYSNLLGAALASGLPEAEARQTIRSGLSAGAQKPRPLRPVDERPA